MKEKVYDYIIYSANLLGCVYSVSIAEKGASVLLLNNYGFAGGDLTHSLCSYQKIFDNQLSGITEKIYQNIISSKNSVFYKNQDDLVLNPETIKIVLQEILEESKIDLLFHVFPIGISKEDDFINIQLSAREGTIIRKAKRIIDTSESYTLMKFAGLKKKLTKCSFNLFLCKSSSVKSDNYDKIVLHKSVNKSVKLDDSRFWISLNVPFPENELFVENISQKLLNEFEMFALENGGRVQLVAPQTFRKYQVENSELNSELISHPKVNLIKNFNEDEIFLEANYYEKELNL
ncbi:MAG: FAD-dependent oxidoreductase [Ignavibacterium sp.]|nr:FAD-dependent oxidoreductase [Ignavibacterium sp.]